MFSFAKTKQQASNDENGQDAPNKVPTADCMNMVVKGLETIISGNYIAEPEGNDPVSAAIRNLVQKLREDTLHELDNTVSMSIEANETSVFAARMLTDVRKVSDQVNSIAAAAEEMVASVTEINSYGENIAVQAEEADRASQQGSSATSSAVEKMERIVESVEQTVKQVAKFSEFSRKISSIADNIKRIAHQTNLLALNATIEAARAGEAGRGFAVVASEVKTLSKQTTDATTGIDTVVEQLQAEMHEITSQMQRSLSEVNEGQQAMGEVGKNMSDIQAKISEVKKNTVQISGILSQQAQASQEVASGITDIAERAKNNVASIENIVDSMGKVEKLVSIHISELAKVEVPNKVIKLAKSDHVIWKKRLVNMMVGKETLKVEELADHHQCRLGKWYDSVKDDCYRNHPSFPGLVNPHSEVHAHGKEVARLYNEGNFVGALEEITKVEEASQEVLRILGELDSKK